MVKNFNINEFLGLIFLLLPAIYSVSNALADIIISLIALYGLKYIILDKQTVFLQEKWFLFFFIFILYISFHSIFLANSFESFHSSFLIIRFPLFAIAILVIFEKNSITLDQIGLFIYLTIIIFSAIIIIEFFFFDSYRPAGPFNISLNGGNKNFIAGNFISKFYLISIASAYLFLSYKKINYKKKFLIASVIIITFAIILTQERVALLFTALSLLIMFIYNKFFSLKIFFTTILIIITFSTLVIQNKFLHERLYLDVIKQVYEEKNILSYFNTARGQNHLAAYEIWNSNKIFGVGVTKYELECKKKKLLEIKINKCANYPFNIFLEILSETGLVGLSFFLIFISLIIKKNFYYIYKYKYRSNYIQQSSLVTFLIICFPLIPSFSFFSQGFMILFWLILTINLISMNKNK